MTQTIYVVNRLSLPPCMGGWCKVRQSCARYHDASPRQPTDRLCAKESTAIYQPLDAEPSRRITRYAA